jgi:hypothetical protein
MVFPVNAVMLCFTSDVVSEYAFGESYNLLQTEDFSFSLLVANKKIGEYSHSLKQFPWLVHVFNFIPQDWIARLSPDFALILGYQDVRNKILICLCPTPTFCELHVDSKVQTILMI